MTSNKCTHFLLPNEQVYVLSLRQPTSVRAFFNPTNKFTYFLLDNQQVYVLSFTQRTSLHTFS